jgi:hypothetical protein
MILIITTDNLVVVVTNLHIHSWFSKYNLGEGQRKLIKLRWVACTDASQGIEICAGATWNYQDLHWFLLIFFFFGEKRKKPFQLVKNNAKHRVCAPDTTYRC